MNWSSYCPCIKRWVIGPKPQKVAWKTARASGFPFFFYLPQPLIKEKFYIVNQHMCALTQTHTHLHINVYTTKVTLLPYLKHSYFFLFFLNSSPNPLNWFHEPVLKTLNLTTFLITFKKGDLFLSHYSYYCCLQSTAE